VAEILKAKNVLVENIGIQPGCSTSRIVMGCKNKIGIEQELIRNSLPRRDIHRTPNQDLYFDDT
jgi:hypothetical protein